MHKKFLKINHTKIDGGCQLGGKVVTHDSKTDLSLVDKEICIRLEIIHQQKKGLKSWQIPFPAC